MPITKSAKKKLRKDRKREVENLKLKKDYKKTVKKTRENPNKESLTEASKILDKAAKKGIIHKNKAARIKSRLSHKKSSELQTSSKKKKTK
jgi:small subunit ribosomal protein S20